VDSASKPPYLLTTLEAVAGVMGVTDGRLELIFEHGRLVRWFVHSERKHPRDLGEFDERAGASALTSSRAGDAPEALR
jgi:hypothetical protein